MDVQRKQGSKHALKNDSCILQYTEGIGKENNYVLLHVHVVMMF